MPDALDLHELLQKALEAVRRDLNHVFGKVGSAKLSPTDARDLVSYAKLLHELTQDERKRMAEAEREVGKLTTEQLEEKARALLSGRQP